jgi:cyclic pyranopterin monophosphate synthase
MREKWPAADVWDIGPFVQNFRTQPLARLSCPCALETNNLGFPWFRLPQSRMAGRHGVEYDNLFLMPKPMPKKLSHYDSQGQARMVDVSRKARTAREAEASAFVLMTPKVLRALPKNPKGDPLELARTAGIMAAKRTSELIPMCHPVALSHIAVSLRVCENGVSIVTKVKTTAETGVEMEALVAASVAALTVYDMCKALDKGIEIREVVLERKSGGKSGDYKRGAKRK